MGRLIELEKRVCRTRRYEVDKATGRTIVYDDEAPAVEARVVVDLDELLGYWIPLVARERGLDINEMTAKEKLQLLIEMGYGKYLDVLRREAGFEWLSET